MKRTAVKIAALYDIHRNLPALEAVLADLAREQVERIVIGGDVVAGPMPRETLALLRSLSIPVQYLMGNADRELLAVRSGASAGLVPPEVRPIVEWVAQQLSPDDLEAIASWPATVRATSPALGELLFCHATPHSDTPVFTRLTPDARVAALFDGVAADLVVCGHTHMPFDRRVGALRIVNAGSVGMPYGEPGAAWLLLGAEVEFRRTAYDQEQAGARVLATPYPQAQAFAADNILQVPSEAQALDVFGRMERAAEA
jgi:predicted phosphodiesterase